MKILAPISALLLLLSSCGSSGSSVKAYTSKDCIVTDNELGSMVR
jgi:hypothetical protein